MATMIDRVHAANDLGAMSAAVSAGAATGGELMVASGTVIALRAAIAVQGVMDPANADHREVVLLLPEKSEAVSAASMILLQQVGEAAHRATLFALGELSAAAEATTRIAACGDPSALAAAQGNVALAAFDRFMVQSIAMGTLLMVAQQAAMVPFHRAATANAKRLTTAF